MKERKETEGGNDESEKGVTEAFALRVCMYDPCVCASMHYLCVHVCIVCVCVCVRAKRKKEKKEVLPTHTL